jgi:hypothetical protein
MSNILELIHAKHDEEIALFIHQSKKSDHWTIIVSFYAALHFVRAKLFPLTETSGGVTTIYKSADDYYSRLGPNKPSLHRVLVDLVWKNLNNVGAKYQMLYDTSITARYDDYKHDYRASAQAIKNLSEIKKECTKP